MKWESKFTEKTTTLAPSDVSTNKGYLSFTYTLLIYIWLCRCNYYSCFWCCCCHSNSMISRQSTIIHVLLVSEQFLSTTDSRQCHDFTWTNTFLSEDATLKMSIYVTRNLLHYEKCVSRRELLADQYGLRNCLLESDNFIHSNHILVLTFVWPLNLFL